MGATMSLHTLSGVGSGNSGKTAMLAGVCPIGYFRGVFLFLQETTGLDCIMFEENHDVGLIWEPARTKAASSLCKGLKH